MKRGLKAEMEEAREILDAYVEENRTLVVGLCLCQGLLSVGARELRPRCALLSAFSFMSALYR